MIRYFTSPFKWFFKLEAASGLILLIAAIVALIFSNTNLSTYYFKILDIHIQIGTDNFGLDLSVLHWINDALMAIFFFIVTLEIKREFIQGELSKPKQALLPIIGAVGGMAIPALIYIIINFKSGDTLRGWAIPSATDIAFSIGGLSLLGSRVPLSLKVFLTALAIIDDLGAIVIIAFFYSTELQNIYLLLMLGTFLSLMALNKLGIKQFLHYLIIGIILWLFMCGLFFGKQIGVFLFSYIAIKMKLAEMPSNSNWVKFYAVGVLTGIGFTMSLFVGNLAFAEYTNNIDGVKIGVLVGSFLSAIVGYFMLLLSTKKIK